VIASIAASYPERTEERGTNVRIEPYVVINIMEMLDFFKYIPIIYKG
jgi:hypothetical protein